MWHLQVREKGEGSPGALAASSGEDFSVGTEHRRGRLGVVRGGERCCLKAALPSCEMNARSPILCPKYTDKHYMFRLREDKKKESAQGAVALESPHPVYLVHKSSRKQTGAEFVLQPRGPAFPVERSLAVGLVSIHFTVLSEN